MLKQDFLLRVLDRLDPHHELIDHRMFRHHCHHHHHHKVPVLKLVLKITTTMKINTLGKKETTNKLQKEKVVYFKAHYIKDLCALGRDLSKVMINKQ